MSLNDQINEESVEVCEALTKSLQNDTWKRVAHNRIERNLDGLWIEFDVPGQNRNIFWVSGPIGWSPVRFHDISAKKVSESVYQGGKVLSLARAVPMPDRNAGLFIVRHYLGLNDKPKSE